MNTTAHNPIQQAIGVYEAHNVPPVFTFQVRGMAISVWASPSWEYLVRVRRGSHERYFLGRP